MKTLKLMFAAIRTIIFYLGYVIVTVFLSSVLILSFPFLSDTRRHSLSSLWCNSVLQWLKLCCGVNYKISGLENIPTTPCVIVANHQSSWETVLFYSLVFPVSPILKKELLKIPFWGWAMGLFNPIAIDRSKPRQAGRSLLLQGSKRLSEGFSVILFPEGRRSPPGELGKFSRSAAKLAIESESPILPIHHNAGNCWPPGSFIKHAGMITVTIGKPVPSLGRGDEEFTAEIRQWILDQSLKL
ncbi:MAG: lysophospholipid acyltransferase family protein [Pseudohongiellaceae bacterium]